MIGCGLLRALRARRPASSRMTSSGSLPSGSRTTSTSVSRPSCRCARSRPRARTTPSRRTSPRPGRRRRRRRPGRCAAHSGSRARPAPRVSAVPSVPTTLSKPCWCAISASVLPSTSTAVPCLRMAPLARSIRYSVRLLSNSSVAGELRYLGPRDSPSSRLASLPTMRPPRPVALPDASRMGKMIRPRNRS